MINVPAAALDKFFGNFFKDACKQNGSLYEPDSISSFQKAILGLFSLCSSVDVVSRLLAENLCILNLIFSLVQLLLEANKMLLYLGFHAR